MKRLSNLGKTNMQLIGVQTEIYLEKEDIIRCEDI